MVDTRTSSSKSSKTVALMGGDGMFATAYNRLREDAATVDFDPSSPPTQLYAHFITDDQFIPALVANGYSVTDYIEEIQGGHSYKLDYPATYNTNKTFSDAVKDVFLSIKENDMTKLETALDATQFLPSNVAPVIPDIATIAPISPAQAIATQEIEDYLKSIEDGTAPTSIPVATSTAEVKPVTVPDMAFWDGFITNITPPVDTAKIEAEYRARQNSHMGALDDKPVLATTHTAPDLSPKLPEITSMITAFNSYADKPPVIPTIDTPPVVAITAPDMVSTIPMDAAPIVGTTVPPAPTQNEPVLASAKMAENDFSEHTVSKGENLWEIARDHYGIDKKDTAAIQKAVETIAQANGMDGLDANKIDIGQTLKLPDNPFSGTQELDWAALDKDSGISATHKFNPVAEGNDIQVAANEPTPPRPQPRPEGLAPAA